MSIPVEFTAEAVAAEAEAASSAGVELFAPFLASGEPYRSLLRHNPWLKPPRNEELFAFLFQRKPTGRLHNALADCRVTLACYIEGRGRMWW